MEDVQTLHNSILVLVALLSVLGSAIGSIATIKSYFKRAVNDSVEEEVEERIEKAKEEMEHELELSLTSLQGAINTVSEQMKVLQESMDDARSIQKDNIQANGKFIINEAHKTCLKQGWIDRFTLASLEDIYKIYSDVGGNHFAADHMDDLRKLPNEKPIKTSQSSKSKR